MCYNRRMAVQDVFKKTFILTGIMVFLFVSFFGVLHMGMASDATMRNCPFDFGVSLCTMTPLQHIGAAQSFLNNLSSQTGFLYFLLLVVSLAISLALFFVRFFSPPKLSPAYSRFYNEYFSALPTFLQQAYSRGILNPKTF